MALALGAALVLLASALWSPATLPDVPMCPFRHAFGVPCPGCGLTRSFCAISHGQFRAALDCNPFGYLLYAGAVVLLSWPLAGRLLPSAEQRILRCRRWALLTPVLVAAMYVFGIIRLLRLWHLGA